MSTQQFQIPADGSKVFAFPNFTIRNWQAFNTGTANLSLYDQIGILRAVLGPGGFCSYNWNVQSMSAQLASGGQGVATLVVSDAPGPVQPATAPLVGTPATGLVLPGVVLSAGGSAVTTISFVTTAPVLAGHGIVAYILSTSSGPTVTDSVGNTWAQIGSSVNTGAGFLVCMAVQVAQATPVGATVTVTISGSSPLSMIALDMGGGLTLNANGGTTQSSAGQMTGPAMAPGSNLYLSAIAGGIGTVAAIFQVNSPYTFLTGRFDGSGGTGRNLTIAAELAVQTGTVSPVWTSSVNIGTCGLFGLGSTVIGPATGLPK